MSWHLIQTAPKDGTPILISHGAWEGALLARWGEYPDNPVLDAEDQEVYMEGWIFDSYASFSGLDYHEEGFLGFDDDLMPTHWMPTIYEVEKC